MSRFKRNVLLITYVIVASILVGIFANFLSSLIVSQNPRIDVNQLLPALFAVAGGAIIAALISLAFVYYQASVRRRLLLETEAQYQKDKLLRLSQEGLELEKQRTNLEKQQQNLLWQLAAAEVMEDDPKLAIVTAYQGLESEIQNLITRAYRLDTEDARQKFSVSYNYDMLADYIDPNEARVILQMRDLRNRIVHGEVRAEEITEDKVRNYVQNAGFFAKEVLRAAQDYEAQSTEA